jgi:hypothetical protein
MHAAFGLGTTFPSSLQANPFAYGFSPYAGQQQWLQAIPQQLNQLQQLAYAQQQQLQQLLQIVPAQLQQIQQLLQIVAQQQLNPSLQQGIGLTQPQGFPTPFQGFSPYAGPFAGSGHVM